MKHIKLYLTALLFAAVGITGCDDNWDTPPFIVPEATIEANTSIFDMKSQYWSDESNFVDTVGLTADGQHMIIKGRVVSSDAAGNIYKNIVVQDESAAVTFSINANNLYNIYRLGQEVVIDVTDMYIGKFAGLQQFGFPDYSDQFGWQTTFMPLEFFKLHVQMDGLPDPGLVQPMDIKISDLPSDKEGIIKMQSRLVRINDIQFEEADGVNTFARQKETVSRNITDGKASMIVRTSGYANFYDKVLPEGVGNVTGILGYFNGKWQLTLRSYDDCQFAPPAEGSKQKPYTVENAIKGLDSAEGWVKGFIVGAVAPGKSVVAGNSDVEWAAPFSLPNTLLIADDAKCNDIKKCLVIELPQNSVLRAKANLADNADNLGSPIMLKGSIKTILGMAGIAGNNGTADEFVFSSTSAVTMINEDFESYGANMKSLVEAGWTLKKLAGDKDWFLKNFSDNTYASVSGFKGKTPPFDAWLITPAINIDKVAEKVLSFRTQVNPFNSHLSTFGVYVLNSNDPATAEKTKLDAVIATPEPGKYSPWANSGNIDLSKFTGKIYIAFHYNAPKEGDYATWCVDDVKVGVKGEDVPNTGDRDGSEAKPYTVADVNTGVEGFDKWATGYIVGFSSSFDATKYAVFSAENAQNNNVLLADTPNEKDITKCIAVALPTGAVKDAVNLKDNPANFGKKLTVKGQVTECLRIRGVKNATAYKF